MSKGFEVPDLEIEQHELENGLRVVLNRDVAVDDPSSDVASGGVYDPSTAQGDADFDTGIDAGETSIDPGIDTTPDFTE